MGKKIKEEEPAKKEIKRPLVLVAKRSKDINRDTNNTVELPVKSCRVFGRSEKAIRKKVWELFDKYEERFREEWKDEGRYVQTCFGDYSKYGLGELAEAEEEFVERQLEFISEYIGFTLVAGYHKETLDHIRFFLDAQGGKQVNDKMLITFFTRDTREVFAYVYDLNDIDLEDVYAITDFDTMIACLEDGKMWSKKSAKAFMEEVKSDLEDSGKNVPLEYQFKKDRLIIYCSHYGVEPLHYYEL